MTDRRNRALTLLAVEPVGALSENVSAARVVFVPALHCKRVVLSEFLWPFAMRTAPSSRSRAPIRSVPVPGGGAECPPCD